MAEGARRRLGSDYALSTTGWAGPDGDDVGEVWCGVTGPSGGTVTQRYRFTGTRTEVERKAALGALELLRDVLTGERRGDLEQVVEDEYRGQGDSMPEDPTYTVTARLARALYCTGNTLSVVDGLTAGNTSFNISTVPHAGSWYMGGEVVPRDRFDAYAGAGSPEERALRAAERVRDEYRTTVGLSITPLDADGTVSIAVASDGTSAARTYSLQELDDNDEVAERAFEQVIASTLLPGMVRGVGRHYFEEGNPWSALEPDIGDWYRDAFDAFLETRPDGDEPA